MSGAIFLKMKNVLMDFSTDTGMSYQQNQNQQATAAATDVSPDTRSKNYQKCSRLSKPTMWHLKNHKIGRWFPKWRQFPIPVTNFSKKLNAQRATRNNTNQWNLNSLLIGRPQVFREIPPHAVTHYRNPQTIVPPRLGDETPISSMRGNAGLPRL